MTDFETGLTAKEASLRLRLSGISLAHFLRYLYRKLKWIVMACVVVGIAAIVLTGSYIPFWLLMIQILAALGLIAVYHNRPRFWVIRDGKTSKVDIEDLVIGDVIALEKGDIVPENARIIYSNSSLEDAIHILHSNSRTFHFVKRDALHAVICGKAFTDLKMDRIREE